MASEIIPISFAFSVVALMVYIAVFNPKQLVLIKELWTGSAVNRPRPSGSKEHSPNKDRKWGSKARNRISIADLTCSLVSGRLRTTLATTLSKLVTRNDQTLTISPFPIRPQVLRYNGHSVDAVGELD